MQEENYEVEVYTLTDEDGTETEYELIGSMDIDGQSYVALIPYEEETDGAKSEDEELGFIVLRVESEDGEEVFVSIEDEAEFDKVASAFEEELMAEIDHDEDGEEEEEETAE